MAAPAPGAFIRLQLEKTRDGGYGSQAWVIKNRFLQYVLAIANEAESIGPKGGVPQQLLKYSMLRSILRRKPSLLGDCRSHCGSRAGS